MKQEIEQQQDFEKPILKDNIINKKMSISRISVIIFVVGILVVGGVAYFVLNNSHLK